MSVAVTPSPPKGPGVGSADVTDESLSGKQWRRLAISVYLPTTLSFIGFGAVTPLIALTAHDLGATTAQAAFVVALLGIGGLLGALPAGALTQRVGERRAIVGSLILDAACMAVAGFSTHLWVLAAAVLVMGLSGAVLIIGRQSFLTEFIPFRFRARALSTLGGVFRVGALLGPLAGAAVGTVSALPVALVASGAVLTVKAVEVSARGTVFVLERASDGAAASIEIAGAAAGGLALSVGAMVTTTVIASGVVLSAAGEAIAFIPNAIGRALLHNQRIAATRAQAVARGLG